jgi:hypothetical protein
MSKDALQGKRETRISLIGTKRKETSPQRLREKKYSEITND